MERGVSASLICGIENKESYGERRVSTFSNPHVATNSNRTRSQPGPRFYGFFFYLNLRSYRWPGSEILIFLFKQLS